ncbi:MAG: serine hydrolase domain-containing protein [Anaerolineae bacterium]
MLLMLLVSVFAFSPVTAQPDDPQAALDAVVEAFAPGDAALVVQVTTPEGTVTSTSGLARPDQPTTADDRFRIASMSKTYVAAVALLLAEEGVFDLDDAASEWLPESILENLANADEVTLRQLLAMRSGIPDYLAQQAFWDTVLEDPFYAWTPEESLAFAFGVPAEFAPDDSFSYSNSNYLLMQLVMEAATGEPLHVLMRDYLLDPLGLEDTYTQIMETLPGEFVQSFYDVDEDGTPEEVTNVNDGAGMGDGALISNAADITAFYQALLQDESILSEDSMAELLDFETESGYSLGLGQWESDYGAVIGHSGGVLGYTSIGLYIPDEETIIVVLLADLTISADEIALAVAEAFFA